MSSLRSRLLFIATLLVVFAGCAASESTSQGVSGSPPTAALESERSGEIPPESEAETLPEPETGSEGASGAQNPAPGRIVVNTSGGGLFVLDADGSNRVVLTDGASTAGLAPVWSPDGQRIAWSDASSTAGPGAIVSANADGSDLQRAETPFVGYFGLWDPTQDVLGFLGNAAPGTGLVLDDGSGRELGDVVDSDTFYFFSWSPDGTQWVVHSGSGLHIADRAGVRTTIDLPDALFRAPIWAPDGSIFVVLAHEGSNVVARVDPETFDFEELVSVGEVTNLVLDPTGRRLAIDTIHSNEAGTDLGNGITVSYQDSAAQAPAGAEVLVYDLQTDAVTRVHDGRIGSASWSPDGSLLAMLVPERGQTPRFAQWLVWGTPTSDTPGAFRTDRFVPTAAFARTYMPFYDQFAQSVTPWSPDSSQFVYTGTDVEGTTGVFVQLATPNVAPEWISEGDLAFWSPR